MRYYSLREVYYHSVSVGNRCFFDCSDSRGSIYGFLGLAHNRITAAIIPDYKNSATEVFRNMAIQLILCKYNLSLFNLTVLGCREERQVPT